MFCYIDLMPTPAATRSVTLESAPSDLAWRVLGLVNLYRLLVAGGLFIASRFTVGRETISIDRPGEMAR